MSKLQPGLVGLLTVSLAVGPVSAAPSARLLPQVSSGLSGAGPRLVVMPVGLDAPSKAQEAWLTSVAEGAVDASGRFTLVSTADLSDPAAADARASKAAEAEEAMKSGQKALDDLDAVKAIDLFGTATAAWRQADLTDEAIFDKFVKSWVMKTASQVANGDNAAAKNEIEKILVVAPRAVFPDSFFPPDLLKIVESQRKSVARASGELSVRTEPAGAKIWIDGVARGASPLKVAGLAGGKHLAVVVLSGFARVTDELQLGDELVKLKANEGGAKVKMVVEKIRKNSDGPGRDAGGRELAALALAEQALLLIAKKSSAGEKLELTLVRLEARDGHNLAYATATVAMGDDKALVTLLARALAKDAPREGKLPVSHFGGGGQSGSGRTVAAVVLFGAAAAALGVGVFCGVSANDKATQYRNTIQIQDQRSNNIASEGKTFAIFADVSYLVAAATAVTGAILLLTGGNKSQSADEEKPAEKKKPEATRVRDEKKPAEGKKPDDARKAPDSKKPDDSTKAEDAKRAEEARKAEDAKKADEARKAEDAKQAEEAKKAAEEAKKKPKKETKAEKRKRLAEEKKAADEAKKAEAAQRAEEAKQAKEAKKADDAKKSDDAKKADDARKSDDSKKAAEARKKEEDEKKKVEDAKKKKPDEEDLRNY